MHFLIPANMLPWLRSEVMRKSEKLGESVVQNQQDCNNVLKFTNFLKTFPCTFNTNLRTLTWDNCSYTSYWSWNWHFYIVRQAIIMERSSTGSAFSTVILRPWVLLWFWGIETGTSCSIEQCSTNWANPATETYLWISKSQNCFDECWSTVFWVPFVLTDFWTFRCKSRFLRKVSAYQILPLTTPLRWALGQV